ncbi:MAG: putative CtpA-like serine protease [Candidatus Ordinivivax streblomastigis]|uniref:Putative CtpA-like serine protease n=1 Tax=Candidatus Ordinivivax streblomastigis TaxID=2540710 RepID=A0A5M8NZ84_9BACT|nr:MAG: putative CtpA-like serine protease [Candidatus Ordinivivax streblomastigis]
MKYFRVGIAVWGCLWLFTPTNVCAQLSEKQRFEIAKNLDVYNALFNELNLFYVDSLEVEKLIQQDIAYLLQQLDPYTEYIPEEDLSDFQFLTTGEYGGIGSIISKSDNKIIIAEPYKGMPAALAGLIPGDEILAINGESMEGKNTAYVSEQLKGQPNTKLQLKIQRRGEKKPRELTLERKRIQIDPVTYYGVLEDGIGYIYLSGFTTHSAQSVKTALLDLTQNRHIRALVFDVRDNGGGVVEDCLEILNYFLPKGELLLSMRGKVRQMDRTYRATQEPIEPTLPIVVLVNGRSASASEILSGAIQDLDRGVIVGSRTYGKGLVQSTRSLPYDGKLKLTTSKYYIPSGRSIQAIDYASRDEYGRVSAIPDSLTTEYYTNRKRPVRNGGGILPDLAVEDEQIPTLVCYIEANNLFFDFVIQWRANHPTISEPSKFVLEDAVYNEFKAFVQSKDFTYDRQSEKILENLKKTMEFEGYYQTASTEFNALEAKLKPDLNHDFELHKSTISNYLTMQILKQYYYNDGALVYALRKDPAVKKSLEILKDKSLYESILGSTIKEVINE